MHVTPLGVVDTLVTDDDITEGHLGALGRVGIDVVVVSAEGESA
ncbi:MAG: hypothetical protein ACRDJ5_06900 [Actinomycetota bacterium]